MSALDLLAPTENNRIYDLLQVAGVDVRDWERSKGNARSAASNPKYCYNWSFVEPGKLVALTLWFEDMEERAGQVTYTLNPRALAKNSKGIRVHRANNMDSAIRAAYRGRLPIRVIVCDGHRRSPTDPPGVTTRASRRLLDPESWYVASYNDATGDCKLRRGQRLGSGAYVDQYSLIEPPGGPAARIITTASIFGRRSAIRDFALKRAKGQCEYCGARGFEMPKGKIYLETHHVRPLHEGGIDSVQNVVALCPNHHREAHHGKGKKAIRRTLLKKLSAMSKSSA